MRNDIPWDAVTELENRIDGPVLSPKQDGYDEERAGFNLAVDHHPALVVGATGAADVAAAVGFAGRYDLPVAVQATGHGRMLPADGALLINTRRMAGVRVDPERATARIEAGARWRPVIDQASPHGLVALSGSTSHVGAVAYTLGGGLSPIGGRAFGYAADHVRSIDVVTADGQLRQASAQQDADLFWGLRGGKGALGVVTAIEVDLMRVPRLYAGALVFPGEAAGAVLSAWQAWTHTVPDEMTSSLALLRFPDAPFVPEPLRNQFVVAVRIGYVGAADAGERLVAPLRAAATPLMDEVRDMPYRDVDQIHRDPTDPLPVEARSAALRDLDAGTVRELLERVGPEADFPVFMVELRHLGGALARPPKVPNAVGNRDAGYDLFTATVVGPGQDERVAIGAMEDLRRAMAPWDTGGRLMNFLHGPDGAAQVPHCYDPETYRRLTDLKAAYDPSNLFRANSHIAPRGEQRAPGRG